ncbi:N-acetyltransferase B complex non catalytic protein [Pyrenophora tritici-repentis]|uniref:N-acetyltransferase B complex non catalytic protein n=4 Tax=Pyrenophora tritici-repentis TaxID=45151 RepID=A0A922SUE2_9PLEO|nr:uncharacterized protein PTRG_02832 [Pyrenophora tritici-repentis Pt-1C-BFP]EDU45355.1 hypothetical protein PTRG_02832 [Pyrenophora tritici-repentis Pt-1C-BFP]KAI1518861.1 N-acetyltransferase B complex non catalytic protein [Pyrenophora tritici-repentis]KAI1672410.1 N-acetyltransferase B complex non catalytic protein [Pyrenophora tritici-repentis]KAI1686435.1 N-acetyltransferase B complex non catalytic protein [Pyrenophora tritici-repentis]
MAFNNWDKLRKAQRDYPKPNKIAEVFVRKALKKSPKNPFLLAWEANLSLHLNHDAETAIRQVQQAWEQPGSNDVRLLSYLYEVLAEATRKSHRVLEISSVGDANSKKWQSAAKTLTRKQDREDFWSALGKVASRERCWEDFRLAVVQYNKEIKEGTTSPSAKKQAHYTQIIALQQAASQQSRIEGGEQKCKIYADLARGLLKQAYQAPQVNPLAFKDIRDLRFMGEVHCKQNRCNELVELWDHPPDDLQPLMATHQDDLWRMKIKLAHEESNWKLVERLCLAYIELAISKLVQDPQSKSFWELCAWKFDTWILLLRALAENHDAVEGRHILSGIRDRAFGEQFPTQDRSLMLAYMWLCGMSNNPMLEHLKIYWEQHSNRIVCFPDIKPFVKVMRVEEYSELLDFVREKSAMDYAPKTQDLHIIEQNTLKMFYYTHCSITHPPPVGLIHWRQGNMEIVFRRAVTSPWSTESNSSIGFIAIYCLLQLHRDAMCNKEPQHPLQTTRNSRLLLQAAMLARHLVACHKEKQDRTLSLLAARLHLNLGLGKCAFQLYRFTKSKEMLLYNLSVYVLSRISLAHPFGADGRGGFSAEEELENVIDSMNRMENKVQDTMIPDLQSITWDKTIGLLRLKEKFRTSLSKLTCITERRRVARLKGESVDNLPVLDWTNYRSVNDDIDRNVFPHYDQDAKGPLSYVMPNRLPNASWMLSNHNNIEACTRVLCKETQRLDYIRATDGVVGSNEFDTPAESRAKIMWALINDIVKIMTWEKDYLDTLTRPIKKLPQELHAMRVAMEKLRMPGSTTLKLEDEPAMFHENMLISCYTKFEVLRALNKMIEHMREKVINPKSTHFMKATLPKNWVPEVETEMKICYEAIRDLARSYIFLIKEKGEAAIKAQIRWGITGQVLRNMLTDADVALYAREYVDSALQAWEGVLKVKLK